jgi:methyl-accepting chemotaxis protein
VSNGVAHALANNQYDDISPVLDGALHENTRLTWIAVTDDTGQLVRATSHAPNAVGVLELDKLLATAPAGEVIHARIGTGSDWVYGAPVKIGSQKVGALRMAVTTAGLDAELAKSLAEADDRARESRQKLLLIALFVLGIGVLAAALQGVSLARPIKVLTNQANRLATGDLGSRVRMPGARAPACARVQPWPTRWCTCSRRTREGVAREGIKIARQVQQAMLPPTIGPTSLLQGGRLLHAGVAMRR